MEAFRDSSLATDATQQLAPLPEALLFKPNSKPSSRSPSRSPRRIHTDPSGEVTIKTYKRIIVCCDGWAFNGFMLSIIDLGYCSTWQDGMSQSRSRYTNVLVSYSAFCRYYLYDWLNVAIVEIDCARGCSASATYCPSCVLPVWHRIRREFLLSLRRRYGINYSYYFLIDARIC